MQLCRACRGPVYGKFYTQSHMPFRKPKRSLQRVILFRATYSGGGTALGSIRSPVGTESLIGWFPMAAWIRMSSKQTGQQNVSSQKPSPVLFFTMLLRSSARPSGSIRRLACTYLKRRHLSFHGRSKTLTFARVPKRAGRWCEADSVFRISRCAFYFWVGSIP